MSAWSMEGKKITVEYNLYHLDIDLVPWNCPQDQSLRPFNVQDQEVDGGIAQGQEQAVEGEALQL